jgi:uncharacterized damage-inducible protein DinB
MNKDTVKSLFAYNYWATREILRAAQKLPIEAFTAPSELTYRNLRGTLVHALDVERSWRHRIRGEPRETWDIELSADAYPSVESLAAAWSADESEMMAWLADTRDEDLARVIDLGPKDRFPMYAFVVHIVIHSTQQRRDAALLIERAGTSPPEIEFLNYADFALVSGSADKAD